jgi:hypothetical protein
MSPASSSIARPCIAAGTRKLGFIASSMLRIVMIAMETSGRIVYGILIIDDWWSSYTDRGTMA